MVLEEYSEEFVKAKKIEIRKIDKIKKYCQHHIFRANLIETWNRQMTLQNSIFSEKSILKLAKKRQASRHRIFIIRPNLLESETANLRIILVYHTQGTLNFSKKQPPLSAFSHGYPVTQGYYFMGWNEIIFHLNPFWIVFQ